MIQIGVLSSNQTFKQNLTCAILRMEETSHIYCKILEIRNQEALLSPIGQSNLFDFLLLDVDTLSVRGVLALGEAIKKQGYLGEIFLISKSEYISRLLIPLRPIFILSETDQCRTIAEIISAFIKETQFRKDLLIFEVDHQIIKLLKSDIVCVQSCGNYIRIFPRNADKFLFKGSLNGAENLLQADYFIRTHRQWLVNGMDIKIYNRKEVVLSNGQHIPVSSDRWPRVREMIRELLEHQGTLGI